MPKRFQVACCLTIPVAIALALVRCVTLPQVLANTISVWSHLLLVAVIAVLAGVLCLGFGKPLAAPTLRGKALGAVTVGLVLTGADMAVSAVWSLIAWKTTGVHPYPSNSVFADVDSLLLYGLSLAGVLGGVFFLYLGVVWFLKRRSVRGMAPILSLAPGVWCWIRIARFEFSYMSSLNLHRSVYELLMLVFETVFFLWFARFVSGVEEKPPRLFTGVALGTGLLTAMACITRVGMLVLQNKTAFEACGLTTAADLGVCVLAFTMAFSRAFADPDAAAEEEPAEEEPVSAVSVQDLVMKELERPETPDDRELSESEETEAVQALIMKELEQPEVPDDAEPESEAPVLRVDTLLPDSQ